MVNMRERTFRKKTGALRIENGLKAGSPFFAIALILPAF